MQGTPPETDNPNSDPPPERLPELARHPAPVRTPARRAGYDGPDDAMTMMHMAKALAGASILPAHFHGNPANVFAVMVQARAADLPVFTALQHMNVIDGRVEESAELVRAMLLARGFGFRVTASTDLAATVTITRPGEVEAHEVTFTMAEAQRMGLAEKRNWRQAPRAMLVARATTRAASWFAPDATMGLANLSHADLGVLAPEALAHLRPDDEEDGSSPAALAAACWQEALGTGTVEGVRAIGRQARTDGLLQVPVDGVTLQVRLVERLEALATPAIDDAAEVQDEGDWLPCGCMLEQVTRDGAHQSDCPAVGVPEVAGG